MVEHPRGADLSRGRRAALRVNRSDPLRPPLFALRSPSPADRYAAALALNRRSTERLPKAERQRLTRGLLDALRDADPRVRGCWDELPIDQRPSRPARVEVRIGIDGDGQVDLAAVVRSENAPASLTRCIAERVRRIRFPAPRTGVTLRRTYAFDPAPVETSDEEL